ncbi:MAG: hypothetical protein ACRC6X_08210 [Culicoidibacterales bacterium]
MSLQNEREYNLHLLRIKELSLQTLAEKLYMLEQAIAIAKKIHRPKVERWKLQMLLRKTKKEVKKTTEEII